MKKICFIAFFLLLYSFLPAQIITREEANSVMTQLAVKGSRQDTARINRLLKVAEFHIMKPGEYTADLDSALLLIREAERLNSFVKSDFATANILLIKSYYSKENKNEQLAIKLLEQAIPLANKQSDKSLLGEILFEQSNHYSYSDSAQLAKRIGLVQQAVSCFEKSGSVRQKARCLSMLGDLFVQKGDLDKALKVLESALKNYESIHYSAVQGVYILIGEINLGRGNYSEALNYSLLALQSAENDSDTSIQLCQINNDIGVIFINLMKHDKAIPYLLAGLKVAEKYNDKPSIYLLAFNASACYVKLNKATLAKKLLDEITAKYAQPDGPQTNSQVAQLYTDIYTRLKQYENGQVYCNKLLQFVDSHDYSALYKVGMYGTIVRFYTAARNFPLALKYLHKGKELLNSVPVSIRNVLFNRFWITVDTAMGNYRSAFSHLVENNTISDSLFTESKNKQIEELQVKYATEKKEHEIQSLSQKSELQAAELEQSKLFRNITIISSSLLLIIILLLLRQYRLKQDNNKLISKKNLALQSLVTEKEWLLKEVHHRVKNNLQTVVSLLELQSESLNDEALSAIHDSQNRIFAMSLIHQKLYQSESIATINMAGYLRELIGHLKEIYNVGPSINIQCDAAAVEMDVSQAIPIGLIVNEAVTNCIKYAFSGNHSNPAVVISLLQNAHDQLELVIQDNGVGLPGDFTKNCKQGLGFKLMNGLAEDIEGGLKIESTEGTRISICFKPSIPLGEANLDLNYEKIVAA
ncbi:MAG: histidine kinase dimerization/phosphoacceptor domain -containing protein [Chitinophagaceae bacterium]